MVIRSVGVLSVGKVLSCLYALLGLIVGGMFTLLALAGAAGGGAGGRNDAGGLAVLFGVGAIIIVPIFYGLAGFIGGLLMGALYNLVASIVGGIEVDLGRGPGDYGSQPNPFQA